MVNTQAGLGASLSFPTVPQEPELQTNDLIYRIWTARMIWRPHWKPFRTHTMGRWREYRSGMVDPEPFRPTRRNQELPVAAGGCSYRPRLQRSGKGFLYRGQ
jgi:hypothetical protein